MAQRRSIKLPITLGVVMIVLLIALTVGWILLAVFGAQSSTFKPLYWTLLTVGTAALVAILVGVVIYLSLSIKAIKLTQRQSNFMDSITHELKSPIASLKLYLQTLNRRKVSEEERESFYQFMLDDVRRLDDLITHMLDAAQLEKPVLQEELIEIDLKSLIENCAREVTSRYRISETSISIEGQTVRIVGRTVDAEMIFRNLLDNAVKYAERAPEIKVSIEKLEEPKCVVKIKDNGPGIPLNQRRKIFYRFVRLGLELERKKPGTGLGLYIVQTLVRRMKGQVRVSGRLDGNGTVFEVRLPASNGEPSENGKVDLVETKS